MMRPSTIKQQTKILEVICSSRTHCLDTEGGNTDKGEKDGGENFHAV